MKYLGTMKSNQGHKRIDHFIRISDHELQVLNILVVKPSIKNGRPKTNEYPIKEIPLVEAHRTLRQGLGPLFKSN